MVVTSLLLNGFPRSWMTCVSMFFDVSMISPCLKILVHWKIHTTIAVKWSVISSKKMYNMFWSSFIFFGTVAYTLNTVDMMCIVHIVQETYREVRISGECLIIILFPLILTENYPFPTRKQDWFSTGGSRSYFCAIDAIYLARGAIYPANSNVWLKMRPMIFEMVPFTWQSSSWRSKVSESHGMPTIKSSHLLRIHYLFSTYFNHISEQCFGLENQDTTPEINSYGNPPVYTVEIGNWSIFQTG